MKSSEGQLVVSIGGVRNRPIGQLTGSSSSFNSLSWLLYVLNVYVLATFTIKLR